MGFLKLPNGRELAVVIDEYSSFPVTKIVRTTAAEHVTPELEEIFGILGIPSVLNTDNGPLFNGQPFAQFCSYMGIMHRKIVPEHPQSNGQAERFMRSLAKAIRSASVEGRDWQQVLNEFLRAYRDTPHPTTGEAPAKLMFVRCRLSRLPSLVDADNKDDSKIRQRDAAKKAQSAGHSDRRRRARLGNKLVVGDIVFAKQRKTSKWMTRFGQVEFRVKATKGTMITVVDPYGRELTRERSTFKRKVGAHESSEAVPILPTKSHFKDKDIFAPRFEPQPPKPIEKPVAVEHPEPAPGADQSREEAEALKPVEAVQAEVPPNPRRSTRSTKGVARFITILQWM